MCNIHIYIYINIYVYTYIHIYIYSYTYTYIHMHRPRKQCVRNAGRQKTSAAHVGFTSGFSFLHLSLFVVSVSLLFEQTFFFVPWKTESMSALLHVFPWENMQQKNAGMQYILLRLVCVCTRRASYFFFASYFCNASYLHCNLLLVFW